jgi:hypothetical protein
MPVSPRTIPVTSHMMKEFRRNLSRTVVTPQSVFGTRSALLQSPDDIQKVTGILGRVTAIKDITRDNLYALRMGSYPQKVVDFLNQMD